MSRERSQAGEPRQKPISISTVERKQLNEQKRRYEESTGDTSDWGKFLGTISLLGLAALGIYGLAKAIERSHQSVKVRCPSCHRVFPLALSNEAISFAHVPCPYCHTDLVVNLGSSAVTIENGHKPFAEWSRRCPSCGHEERLVFVSRPPYRGEQIQVVCHECQESFLIGQPVYEMGIDDLEI